MLFSPRHSYSNAIPRCGRTSRTQRARENSRLTIPPASTPRPRQSARAFTWRAFDTSDLHWSSRTASFHPQFNFANQISDLGSARRRLHLRGIATAIRRRKTPCALKQELFPVGECPLPITLQAVTRPQHSLPAVRRSQDSPQAKPFASGRLFKLSANVPNQPSQIPFSHRFLRGPPPIRPLSPCARLPTSLGALDRLACSWPENRHAEFAVVPEAQVADSPLWVARSRSCLSLNVSGRPAVPTARPLPTDRSDTTACPVAASSPGPETETRPRGTGTLAPRRSTSTR